MVALRSFKVTMDIEGLENTDPSQPFIFINQFPLDSCITVKDLLAETVPSVWGRQVPWLPCTYNLETELAQFIVDHHNREEKKEDNIWIVKPWNLSRGMGHLLSGDIGAILRQSESGPRIVQKYIERPFLLNSRKFDMRLMVLVKSIEPLEIYLYNIYYARLANVPYSHDSFDHYQKHFTVMNYVEGAEVQQVPLQDIIREFNEHMPGKSWAENVQPKIDQLTVQLFTAAKKTKNGMRHSPHSRAVYGLDLMVTSEGHPMLLEVNDKPDTTKICKWSPSFWNDALAVLFLSADKWGDTSTRVTRLC